MKVLVIIVSYNFERWLSRCLTSLRHSDEMVDTVVIDNGSTDGTFRLIEENFPEVRLIKNRDNKGFGAANNQGIAIAIAEGYDAVYLLNQDAWVMPGAITALARASLAHPEFGILSPVQLRGDGQQLESGFAHYASLEKDGGIEAVKAMQSSHKEVVEAPFVNAAHWFIPIAAIERVGGFSPLFHMYGEDVDLANRFHHLGYKIGYVPQALAVHDREGRKPTKEALRRARYTYLLSEYANPNHTLAAAFAYSVLASLKSMTLNLAKGNGADAAMYLGIFRQLAGKTLAVWRCRKVQAGQATPFVPNNNSIQSSH